MFDFIINYYKEGRGPNCNYQLAVDVGCGNGQATLPLAKYFDHVIGCDISTEQISHAPKDVDRVEFRVCPSENLGFLEDNSVDMLTAGTTFHYFDHEKFYAEAERVLKPGGVLALFSHGYQIVESEEGQKLYEEHKVYLDKYWLVTKVIDTMYTDYVLPFPGWQAVFNNDSFVIRRRWSLSHFMGHMTSNHGWDIFIRENPESHHLEEMRTRYSQLYNCAGRENEPLIDVKFNVCLLIGRKPAGEKKTDTQLSKI